MERKSFIRRFISPVAIVFIVMTVSFIVYNLSSHISTDFLHQLVAHVSAFLLCLSIGFSALYVYYTSFSRGAGLGERIIASFFNPFIWATKEVIRESATFTLSESLYFYLNPLIVGLFFGIISQMGLAEILGRRSLRKQGQDVRYPFSAFAALIIGLSVVVFMLAWGLGVHSFYIFVEGYKAIFGVN